ncbi:MAG TPA: folylpolyglutamate synthase/dihydrofolate synthase family protein [Gemmatimonadaceae bacterium]|nr:folylpolyglutamate synthase/dihydrofolate synthase family protein [Gemmatimonadaceae bacterium]
MGFPLNEYRAAVDALFARTAGGVKPGLERTEALLDAVGAPHRRLRAFHVAGTNGKGSVCATLDYLLRAHGHRVGRYTSPHLVDFRERILIDGVAISEDEVTGWLRDHDALVAELGATFFEATTALALDHFARENVDVAVIETGLGGRLDATNVLPRPIATVVTSIGLDHTDLLGTTVEQIAIEKAGIFKRGSPAIIGERDAGVARQLIDIAVERGAEPILAIGRDWQLSEIVLREGMTAFVLGAGGESRRFETPLLGEHQAYNAALAIVTLLAAGPEWTPATADTIAGLRAVRLPGRFQRRGHIIFDVAHNPAGAAVLARTIGQAPVDRPVTTLLAVLSDKDWKGMMRELAPVTDRFVLTTAPTAPASRVWDLAAAIGHAAAAGYSAEIEPDFARAIERVRRAGGTGVVTGSFHTVGDAMACLQVDPLAG